MRLILACLMLACAGSCVTDVEYDKKHASVRSDWKGNEIVGIWVTKMHTPMGNQRITLLLKPDGTGREITRALVGNHIECYVKWHYRGAGLWTATGEGVPGTVTVPLGNCEGTLQYNGSELLLKDHSDSFWSQHTFSLVFVRAEDEAAVEEHLKKR